MMVLDILKSFKGGFDIIDETTFNKFLAYLSEGLDLTDAMTKSGANASKSFKTYADTVKDGAFSYEGYTEAVKKSGTAMNFAAIKTGLLNAALNAGIMFAATLAIEGIVKGLDALIVTQQETADSAKELLSKYEELKTTADNNAQTVESIAGKYEKLSKGVDNLGKNVSLTTDEYKEYHTIVNQIADMFPKLVNGYDNEGNAILSVKGDVEELRDAYKDAQREANNLLISSGKNAKGNDILENYKNVVSGNKGLFDQDTLGAEKITDVLNNLNNSYGNLDKFKKSLLDIQKLSKNNNEAYHGKEFQEILDKSGINDLFKNITNVYSLDENNLKKASEGIKKNATVITAIIQEQQAKIEASLSDTKILANAFLMNSEDYDKLDEQSKNAASILINNLNTDIANGFNNLTDVGTYVQGIVSQIGDNTDVKDAIESLFNLDVNSLKTNEAKEKIDAYINTISDAVGRKPVDLIKMFGLDDIDGMKSNVVSKLKDEFKDGIDSLSVEDLKIAYSLENTGEMTLDELTDKIKQAKSAAKNTELEDMFALKNEDSSLTTLGVLNDRLDSAQEAYKTLNSAMEEYEKNNGVSLDTLQSIIALGGDYFSALLDENGALDMDRQSMLDLTNARLMEMKAQVQQNQLSRIDTINDEISANKYLAQSNLDTATSINAVTESIRQKVENLGGISEETRNNVLNNALKDFNKVESFFDSASKQIYKSPKLAFGLPENKKDKSNKDKDETKKQIDFVENRLKALDTLISEVQATMGNLVGSAAKNLQIENLIGLNKSKMETTKKAISVYSQMAEEELQKIPARFKDLAKNGGLAIGDFIGDGDSNKDVTEAIDNYRNWADKVDGLNKELLELDATFAKLQLDKFNNIADDYSKQLDVITSSTEKLQQAINYQKSKYNTSSKILYEELISQTNEQISYLNQERDALKKQMADSVDHGIKIGSDEWNEMKNSIGKINEEIISCSISIEEFQDSIDNLHWDNFSRFTDSIGHVNDEIDTLKGLLDNEELTIDGNFSKNGIALLGLLAEKYELAQYQAKQYGEQIEYLKSEYQKGIISQVEYNDKLNELTEAQWDAVSSISSIKQEMADLNKTRLEQTIDAIEQETDAYEELIKKKIEALELAKEEKDYLSSLSDAQKDAATIQRQLDALTGDPTADAKRAKLKEELAEQNKKITEMVEEHSVETQKSALEKQLEDYKTAQENKITTLKETLDNVDMMVQQSLDTVLNNSSVVFATLNELGAKYKISISDAVITPWFNGENALAHYGGVLTVQSSAFIGQLDSIKNATYAEQIQAENTANQLIATFGVSSGSLQNELNTVQSGLYNDYNASQMLYNSIQEVFSANNLDNSGVIGKISQISSALGSLNSDFENFNPTLNVPEIPSNPNASSIPINLDPGFLEKLQWWTTRNLPAAPRAQGFANGGTVKKIPNPLLDHIAKAQGEDTMVAVKYGEEIINPNKLKDILDASLLTPVKPLWNVPVLTGNNIPTLQNKKEFDVNNQIKIVFQGDVNDGNINKIQKQIDISIDKAFKKQNEAFRYR